MSICGFHWKMKAMNIQMYTFTKFGLTKVRIDVYLSTSGGNPTSSKALKWPGFVSITFEFLHHGTKCL